MSGYYYISGTYPVYGSASSSILDKAELAKIQAGFDLLPTPTGFGNSVVKVNAAGTALDLSAATLTPGGVMAGLTGLSGSGAFNLTGATTTVATATPLTNSQVAASTAYSDAAVAVEKARALAAEALLIQANNAALTGIPTAPTAAPGTNTTQIATMAALLAQAFIASLPGINGGTAGQFVTNNGTTASWGTVTPPPSGATVFTALNFGAF